MQSTDEIVSKFSGAILDPIIALLVVAGLLWFFWNIVVMIYKSDDTEAIATGKKNLFWGSIGIAIMVSAIGIINVIKATVDTLK